MEQETQSTALVVHGAPSTANFLQVISQAVLDPSVDIVKMHGLLDVQERMMNKQAEINFNADFHQLQMDLPRITKDGKIIHKGKLIASYAKYETIDTVIRPLLVKYNFSLRFNTEPTANKIIVTGTLSHRDGHSITDKIPLDVEAGGAKNNVQGVGSTIAYGKRYLVGMMLNKDKLRETGSDVKMFLEYMDADSVDEISAADYQKAIIPLNQKLAKKGGAA
jgi:hypothetical protein